jgi:hypothetical protein
MPELPKKSLKPQNFSKKKTRGDIRNYANKFVISHACERIGELVTTDRHTHTQLLHHVTSKEQHKPQLHSILNKEMDGEKMRRSWYCDLQQRPRFEGMFCA